jgi:hypothetical protein
VDSLSEGKLYKKLSNTIANIDEDALKRATAAEKNFYAVDVGEVGRERGKKKKKKADGLGATGATAAGGGGLGIGGSTTTLGGPGGLDATGAGVDGREGELSRSSSSNMLALSVNKTDMMMLLDVSKLPLVQSKFEEKQGERAEAGF